MKDLMTWDTSTEAERHRRTTERLGSQSILPVPVIVYCDGACRPNPGTGAWAYLIKPPHQAAIVTGKRHPETTSNNRMELTACIMALESLEARATVIVHSDSEYLTKAFTENRLSNWKAKPSRWEKVKNADLWLRLDELTHFHTVTFQWVKGHAEDQLNNRVNDLAEGLARRTGSALMSSPRWLAIIT